jgi:hypothetical protein
MDAREIPAEVIETAALAMIGENVGMGFETRMLYLREAESVIRALLDAELIVLRDRAD